MVGAQRRRFDRTSRGERLIAIAPFGRGGKCIEQRRDLRVFSPLNDVARFAAPSASKQPEWRRFEAFDPPQNTLVWWRAR